MGMTIRKMTVKDWINVPDNPRQRDTVKHARKSRRAHLGSLEDPHQVVCAAMVDGEIKWKLDGHTRAYLWENGELEAPRGKLTVLCFSVKNVSEAKNLYCMFDNPSATENANDRLSGACREHGVALASPCLRSHTFVVALQCATGYKEARREYDYVKIWRKELQELDSWDLGKMHSSLVALALVLIANEQGAQAQEFFKKFDDDEGTKTEAGSDGVQVLVSHFIERQASRTTAGWDNIEDLFERAYTCFNAYVDGRRMKSGPRRTKRETFAKEVKRIPRQGVKRVYKTDKLAKVAKA